MKRTWFCFILTSALVSAQSLVVYPPKAEMNGREARQQLIAEASANAYQNDVTKSAIWTSSDPKIVKVDANGMLTPVADGAAKVIAKVNGAEASSTVTVSNVTAPFPWSFRNHVIPVLTKAGCNQGACHGALAGKNGFKLTLRGYDPDVDYDTLTRVSVGRRLSMAEPASSLILLKPTAAIPHGG